MTLAAEKGKLIIMKPAIEIYKLLPATNCGTCGLQSCFGFAAKLASNQASVSDCPAMSQKAREELLIGETYERDSPGTVYEQALVSLQPKIQALQFAKIAPVFGATLVNEGTIEISFLNQTFRVTKEKVRDISGKEPRPWISILIYNHLSMPDPPAAPAGEWITFGSVPASHAKDKAWAGHVEEIIAGHFSGRGDSVKGNVRKIRRPSCSGLGQS